MTHSKLPLVFAALAGLFAGVALTSASQPFAGAKVQTLMRRELAKEFTPGREVLVDLLDVPPHTTLERHWHPGEEFHYCLEGQIELLIDGAEPVVEKAGTASHVPYKVLHTARTGEQSAKVLVVRVHKTGEPMRYLESDSTLNR